jgi:hypothetical protein
MMGASLTPYYMRQQPRKEIVPKKTNQETCVVKDDMVYQVTS